MADDLGYGHLGCYGQEKIQTPQIDRMASEGTRFTQFYAGHCVCAASRSTLMTGRHTGHTSVRISSRRWIPAYAGMTDLPAILSLLADPICPYNNRAEQDW